MTLPKISFAIAVISIIISALALYFTYLSDQRQREYLIVSDAGISFHPSDNYFMVTKEFKVTNISKEIISVREVNFEIEAKGKDNYFRDLEVIADGVRVGYNDELNKIINSGETLTITVRFRPAMGQRAAKFLREHKSSDNWEKVTALCRQLGIDLYDNELNDGQKRVCPSFRQYKGKYFSQFSLSKSNSDVFMLVLHTYRGNVFASDRYMLDIGASAL